MDVYIDTEAITEGLESISHTITNISNCVGFIQSRVAAAEADYTSANYYRSADNMKTAADALNEMMSNLEASKDYLRQLIAHIEGYDGIRY